MVISEATGLQQLVSNRPAKVMATPATNPAPDYKQAIRRMSHGGTISRLTIGQLPDVMKRQLATSRKYRRELEALVVEVKGSVNLTDAHWLDEAVGAETHCAVCRWLLRERITTMSAETILMCSREILKAKNARNKAFERLGLDRNEQDILTALYAMHPDDEQDNAIDPPEETQP